MGRRGTKKPTHTKNAADPRLRFLSFAVGSVAALIIVRLVQLMIFGHSWYTALAIGAQEAYQQLTPDRGHIYMQDSRSGERFLVALNRDYYLVYADTRDIQDDEIAEDVAEQLATIFEYDDEQKFELYLALNKRTDPYEPIEQKVDEEIIHTIKALDLPGIAFIRKPHRFYPEGQFAGPVLGFVGKTDDGRSIGRYGIEGHWEEEIAGSGGFIEGARSALGTWLPLASQSFQDVRDGVDIVLTIDRTVQFQACRILKRRYEEFGATSASLVIMDPNTGAIRAMCSFPDFDPNVYSEVDSIDVYNNTTIFTQYEPGSIFKPLVIAAAIDNGDVLPQTMYYDSGEIDAGCSKPIRNAGTSVYEQQSMNGIMKHSINTGMVFVARELGRRSFVDYVERFGFGVKTGIALDSEVPGNIDNLTQSSKDTIDCYAAAASFGQGITVTPLQMVTAFSAIANGGVLMHPYIVDAIVYPEGKSERAQPKDIGRVIDWKTAQLVSGMMVNVIDDGQAKSAGVEGYYVAGKTGTAQIAGEGGYTEETNHSFVGFAPIDDPAFVMIVKFEKPQRQYSVSTAAPTFGEIARFLLTYYQVPPER